MVAPQQRSGNARGTGWLQWAIVYSPCAAMSSRPLSPIGKAFAVAAFIEAITWAGLLLGMWLKYKTGAVEQGVWLVSLFGRAHGIAFLAYVVITVMAGVRQRWPVWALGLAILAAVPPLVTVPLEIWYRRRGLLSPRQD